MAFYKRALYFYKKFGCPIESRSVERVERKCTLISVVLFLHLAIQLLIEMLLIKNLGNDTI